MDGSLAICSELETGANGTGLPDADFPLTISSFLIQSISGSKASTSLKPGRELAVIIQLGEGRAEQVREASLKI